MCSTVMATWLVDEENYCTNIRFEWDVSDKFNLTLLAELNHYAIQFLLHPFSVVKINQFAEVLDRK